MFCCGPSLATDASVSTTPKCCKRFLKLISCCRGTIADDGQDGHDNGHDIHLKCVLACCGGTVADNIADRANREECCAEQEQKRKRKTKSKNKNKREKTVQKTD